jgi:RsiW-degrading membrane proteinase PrsW (M82 family)
LLTELKRRKVYRVAVVYAVVAFVVWQAAEIAFPSLHLPEWTLTFVVVIALIGFPIALVLAWAFEITPEGVRRTEPVGAEAAEVPSSPAPAVAQHRGAPG